MHETVRRLAEVTGWTGRSYVETPWDIVHAKLGFELPSDYRDLHAVFPPGTFDAPGVLSGVMVQPPYRVDGVPDHLHQFEVEMDETEDWRREHPEDVPEDMVPWARADREGLFWVRRSPDPERWTIAISSAGILGPRRRAGGGGVRLRGCGVLDWVCHGQSAQSRARAGRGR